MNLKQKIKHYDMLIQKQEVKISKMREQQREIAKKLIIEKQEQYASHIGEIVPIIKRMLKILTAYKYPASARCSHFGVSSYKGFFDVSLSIYNKEYLSLVIETLDNWVLHNQVGLKGKDWDELSSQLTKAFGIKGKWNGKDGQYSGTFLLGISPPKSLLNAVNNYIAFEKCEFNDLFDANYKKVEK